MLVPNDLRERTESAIKRISSGQAPMRVPVDPTDPDVVLAEWLRVSADFRPHGGEAEVCLHEWIDDGEFMLACTKCGAQEDHDPGWRDPETAPKDGTMLRLLVKFTEHSTEDQEQAITIGANQLDNTDIDQWQFAGWCWTHDHFTEGEGEVIGWLPMLDNHAPPARLQAEVSALPELTSDLRGILGRPNFTCNGIAQALRLMGFDIPKKSEEEQAATIYWMLGHYLRDPVNWRDAASAELKSNAPKPEAS